MAPHYYHAQHNAFMNTKTNQTDYETAEIQQQKKNINRREQGEAPKN